MALSFRSAASSTAHRFSNIIAASLVAATYAVAPIPAESREIEGLPPHCAKLDGDVAKYKCGSAYYQQMRRDAEARSTAAKALSSDAKLRGAEADKEGVCLKAIMTDLESNGAKTASLTAPPPRGEACKLARSLKLVAG